MGEQAESRKARIGQGSLMGLAVDPGGFPDCELPARKVL